MGIVAADNQYIVQCPAGGGGLTIVSNFQSQCGSFADDKFRIQYAPHFVADTAAGNRSDESKVSDVDSKNGKAGAAEPMRGLEQSAVTAAGNYEVGLKIAQIGQTPVEMALWRQSIRPLSLNALVVENSLERHGDLLCVVFGSIDDNDNFADF